MSMPTFSSTNPQLNMQSQPSKRPRLLKDFLQDDTNSTLRLQPQSTKNRSAFQVMLNALVKNISFAAVKSPSILPRSLSRKLSSKQKSNKTERDGGEMQIITVRLKDIIRWKSFRDLVEDRSPPSDPSLTTTTTSGSCSSRGSSWCDSDFTSEYLPEEEEGKRKTDLPCVGRDWVETTTETEGYNRVGLEEDVVCEEKEQYSPLSILSPQFRDDEDPFSHFHQDFANMEKWMSMEGKARCGFEQKEEAIQAQARAMELIEYSSVKSCGGDQVDQTRNDSGENENVPLEWGLLGHNKELCVREMDKGGMWSEFQEEQQEVCLEIEQRLFGSMFNEILRDLLLC